MRIRPRTRPPEGPLHRLRWGEHTSRVGHVGGVRRASHRHIYHAPRSYHSPYPYYGRSPYQCWTPVIVGIILLTLLLILSWGTFGFVIVLTCVGIYAIYQYQKRQETREPTSVTSPIHSPTNKRPASVPRSVRITPMEGTESRYCPQCKGKIESSDIFCVECGNKVI